MKKEKTTKTAGRNRLLFTLLLSAALACTACGADSAPIQDTEENPPQDAAPENGAPQQTDGDSTDGHNSQTDKPNQEENIPDSSGPESDATVNPSKSNISITMQQDKEEKTADDGTVYYTKTVSYPVVAIEGNEAASDKINADIQSKIDLFFANNEVEEWAEEGYSDVLEEGSEYPFIGYSEDLSFSTQRADSNVISFAITSYAFTGGAHGNSSTIGVNYYTKTGEPIAFSELSKDPAAFHEDTLSYNQKLAETDSYKERMFSSELLSDGSLESVLYADNAWYLSPAGLTFISDPYALGPYAAGTIEFVIPYGDLADMGFEEAYQYTDRLIMKLQENVTYSQDLNGDGKEDSILLYTEYAGSDENSYVAVPHLIINDKDFAQDDNGSLENFTKNLTENTSWPQAVLYDLNVEDPYIDLALLFGILTNDQYDYYSCFFRYLEDGSLVYLGKTKGDVSDPTAEISWINNK